MFRNATCFAAALLIAGSVTSASAQTTPAPSAPAASSSEAKAKPSRIKLTAQRLKEMRAKWSANKGKLKACRRDVKAKGLAGDERWFYIEECMDKT